MKSNQILEQQKLIIPLDNLALIHITGDKASEFLQGQLTCDMSLLSSEQAAFAACCNPKGRMIANFWVWPWQNDFLICLPKNMQALVIEHLNKYAIFSKVNLQPFEKNWVIHCYIDSNKKNENIHLLAQTDTEISLNIPGSFARHLWIGEPEVIQAKYQNKKDTQITDENLWHLSNIEIGLTLLQAQITSLFTPQMIQLEEWGGVSFTKGCYVGQEIIARTQHLGKLKRHIKSLEYTGIHSLNIGDDIKDQENKTIGIITEIAKKSDGNISLLAVMQDQAADNISLWPRDFKIAQNTQ